MNKLILFLALIGLNVSAMAQLTAIDSGYCGASGNNLTWKLTTDNVLTIEGSGKMMDYSYDVPNNTINTPWFSYQKTITTLIIGNSVTNIGYYAFFTCSKLTSVTIGNNVTGIGYFAFGECNNLTSVSIPDKVTSIGYSAFYNCGKLTSVIIGNNVTSIEDFAFCECSNLISVSIPDKVTSIGYATFADCSKLISVTIGNSVTSIGEAAFASCYKLTSVTIGNSVTSIGEAAFADCYGLDTIICKPKIPPIMDYQYTFFDVPKNAIVIIPCNTTSTYQNTEWGLVFTNFREDCTSIVSVLLNNQLRVYPNPAKNQLTIECRDVINHVSTVEIYDVVGQLMQSAPMTSPTPSKGGELAPSLSERAGGEVVIDISHLPAGMYFLKVGNKTARFVKE